MTILVICSWKSLSNLRLHLKAKLQGWPIYGVSEISEKMRMVQLELLKHSEAIFNTHISTPRVK